MNPQTYDSMLHNPEAIKDSSPIHKSFTKLGLVRYFCKPRQEPVKPLRCHWKWRFVTCPDCLAIQPKPKKAKAP